MRQGNSSQPFGLLQPSRQQPSFPSALCRGLGQEAGSAGAAVKSRAACAEDSLEMQELEVNGLSTSPAQSSRHRVRCLPQPRPYPRCHSPPVQPSPYSTARRLGGTAVSQGERMLITPGPGCPCHRSCLSPCPSARQCWGSLPACQLLRRCPGSGTGHPRCPRSNCLSLARDKPVAEQLEGFPQPWTSWDYLSFRAAPGASYSPSAPQPAPLLVLHT